MLFPTSNWLSVSSLFSPIPLLFFFFILLFPIPNSNIFTKISFSIFPITFYLSIFIYLSIYLSVYLYFIQTGETPPVPALPPLESQNRFNAMFMKFIHLFSERWPLIMFLDDLQWADVASLKLIELLLQNPGTYLLPTFLHTIRIHSHHE